MKKTKQQGVCRLSTQRVQNSPLSKKGTTSWIRTRERERMKSNWRFDVCLQKTYERTYCQKRNSNVPEVKVNVSWRRRNKVQVGRLGLEEQCDLATQQHCLTQSLVKLSEEDLEITTFQWKLKWCGKAKLILSNQRKKKGETEEKQEVMCKENKEVWRGPGIKSLTSKLHKRASFHSLILLKSRIAVWATEKPSNNLNSLWCGQNICRVSSERLLVTQGKVDKTFLDPWRETRFHLDIFLFFARK